MEEQQQQHPEEAAPPPQPPALPTGYRSDSLRVLRDGMGGEAFTTGWKFVTLWIGGNDMCSRATSAQEFGNSIEAALDFLQEDMPRTFVNLVTAVDVGNRDANSGGPGGPSGPLGLSIA